MCEAFPGRTIVRSFESAARSDWPEGDGTGIFIPFTIGYRDNLSKAEAAHCAKGWREVTARYPKASFYFNILGYDDDPRELWEFAEIRRYVRRWARLAGLNDMKTADFWVGSYEGRLPKPLPPSLNVGLGVLAACGVFGEAIRQQALRQHKPTIAN
jgi:hypothetical protein